MNKPGYVMWGIGQRGKFMLNCLMEKERVKAIIDIAMNAGDYYEDIPIISLKQYKESYADCTIIVSPYEAKQSICNQLKAEGIDKVVDYDTFYEQILRFTWLPKMRLTENVSKKADIFIISDGYLAYDLFLFYERMGYAVHTGKLNNFIGSSSGCVE